MVFAEELNLLVERAELVVRSCRLISEEERRLLETFGNVVTAGTTIYVPRDEAVDLSRFKSNVFLNSVVLNCGVSESRQVSLNTTASCLPSLDCGVYNSTLSDVLIDGPVYIKDSALVHSSYIGGNSALIGNGLISGGGGSKIAEKDGGLFGFGSEIFICEETGTRAIVSSPDLSLESITRAIASNERRKRLISEIEREKAKALLTAPRVFFGSVIAGNCVLMNNAKIESAFIKAGCSLSCSNVIRCYIGKSVSIQSCIVSHSVAHQFSSIENFALVQNSILFPHAKVSLHGKVVHSVIGSYSGVESGECISSLIGPFVGFHHQALCIATYWPQGKGNIGYGANVGSNHSGKAPDCELVCGEGIFFGLACVIKFPCNFSKAVYSLIASGVTCLPQKMEFPFSLINSGSIPTLSSGLNELVPAWVLSDNMFTLLRNEDKFKKRQEKNENSFIYDHQVFRKDTMLLVVDAIDRLTAVACKGTNGIYTEAEIPGLGKNYLKEPTRLRAIDTYSFILRWYGLRAHYLRTGDRLSESDPEYVFGVEVLKKLKMNLSETKSLLQEFAKLDFLISSNCVTSKTKDDVRGEKIIGSQYSEFHPPAAEHPVCVSAKRNSALVQDTVTKMVSKL